VTGAAGIGGETARVLLSKGATVYLAGRNKEKSETAIAEIKKSTGKDACHFVQVDLGDLKAIKAGAESFLQQADRLDALVLNAGKRRIACYQLMPRRHHGSSAAHEDGRRMCE